jgi:hypothetical protein
MSGAITVGVVVIGFHSVGSLLVEVVSQGEQEADERPQEEKREGNHCELGTDGVEVADGVCELVLDLAQLDALRFFEGRIGEFQGHIVRCQERAVEESEDRGSGALNFGVGILHGVLAFSVRMCGAG